MNFIWTARKYVFSILKNAQRPTNRIILGISAFLNQMLLYVKCTVLITCQIFSVCLEKWSDLDLCIFLALKNIYVISFENCHYFYCCCIWTFLKACKSILIWKLICIESYFCCLKSFSIFIFRLFDCELYPGSGKVCVVVGGGV